MNVSNKKKLSIISHVRQEKLFKMNELMKALGLKVYCVDFRGAHKRNSYTVPVTDGNEMCFLEMCLPQ